MLNVAGHASHLTSDDEYLKRQLEPASYVCWMLAMGATMVWAAADTFIIKQRN